MSILKRTEMRTLQGSSKVFDSLGDVCKCTNSCAVRVIIRGHLKTGKTRLFEHLHGRPFSAKYEPTSKTQKSWIKWNYKGMLHRSAFCMFLTRTLASDDSVTVEIIDVFDAGMFAFSGHQRVLNACRFSSRHWHVPWCQRGNLYDGMSAVSSLLFVLFIVVGCLSLLLKKHCVSHH